MISDLYTTRDADGEGADRCAGCPTRAALARQTALVDRLIAELATAHGISPAVERIRHVRWDG